jgi:hypothetical protein
VWTDATTEPLSLLAITKLYSYFRFAGDAVRGTWAVCHHRVVCFAKVTEVVDFASAGPLHLPAVTDLRAHRIKITIGLEHRATSWLKPDVCCILNPLHICLASIHVETPQTEMARGLHSVGIRLHIGTWASLSR